MSLHGHGALGVRSRLRSFSELMAESALSRRVLLEFSPGLALSSTAWTLDDGNTYRANVAVMLDGILRDVVGCESSAGPGGGIGRLDRVETLAECRATAGTYFYDVDAATVALETWDQAGLQWDQAGLFWDTYPPGVLYVHLHDNADATSAEVTVVPLFGFFFADAGCVHPTLGPNKLDTAFTAWTEAEAPYSGPDTWDAVGLDWDAPGKVWDPTSGWTATRGVASLVLASDGAQSGYAEAALVVAPMVSGRRYRLSGEYSTPVGNAAGLSVLVELRAGSNVLYEDGRTADPNGGITLTPTHGETRRFQVDFLVPTYTGDFAVAFRLEGSGAGSVTFSAPKLQRIWRFEQYEPRLAETSLPEVETAATSIFFDRKAVSLGSLTIINGDGALEPVFGGLLLNGRPAQVWVGGSFADGQEVTKEDMRTGFLGYTIDVDGDDQRFSFSLEDYRTFLKLQLPLRRYSVGDFESLDPAADGRPRPYLFGRKGPIAPARIGRTANGYQVCEWADTQRAPNGIGGLPVIPHGSEGAYRAIGEHEFVIFSTGWNPDLSANGATGYGTGSVVDDADSTGLTLNGVALGQVSSFAIHYNDDSVIPAGAEIVNVVVRVRAGQYPNAGGFGRIPFSPYLRYGTGTPLVGAQQTPTEAFQWHEVTFATDPDGSPWTRATVFAKSGNDLRVGVRGDGAGLLAGEFTDISEVRFVVNYSKWALVDDIEFASYANAADADKPLRVDSEGVSHLYGGGDVEGARSLKDRLSSLYDTEQAQYTEDLAAGKVTLTHSPRVVAFGPEGRALEWTTERGTRSWSEGFESVRTIPDMVRFAQRGFDGFDPDVTITYSDTTKLVTVTKPSGTLTLKIATATEKDRSMWPALGFEAGTDRSGSLTYAADNVAYDEARDLDGAILRGIIDGFRDDAAGTFTGTPSAIVARAPDVARFILQRFTGLQTSRVDVPSFVAARATIPGARALTLHVDEQRSVWEILAVLEASAIADIIVSGDGKVYFRSYSADVPATAPRFTDRDYLSFRIGRRSKNVFRGVRLLYGNDHRLTGHDAIERVDAGAAVKHGRPDLKEIVTAVRTAADASVLAGQYFTLATANPRVAEFSAASKLTNVEVGDKVVLSRSRALDPAGELDEVAFRVMRLAHDYISGVSRCEAVEDVPFL